MENSEESNIKFFQNQSLLLSYSEGVSKESNKTNTSDHDFLPNYLKELIQECNARKSDEENKSVQKKEDQTQNIIFQIENSDNLFQDAPKSLLSTPKDSIEDFKAKLAQEDNSDLDLENTREILENLKVEVERKNADEEIYVVSEFVGEKLETSPEQEPTESMAKKTPVKRKQRESSKKRIRKRATNNSRSEIKVKRAKSSSSESSILNKRESLDSEIQANSSNRTERKKNKSKNTIVDFGLIDRSRNQARLEMCKVEANLIESKFYKKKHVLAFDIWKACFKKAGRSGRAKMDASELEGERKRAESNFMLDLRGRLNMCRIFAIGNKLRIAGIRKRQFYSIYDDFVVLVHLAENKTRNSRRKTEVVAKYLRKNYAGIREHTRKLRKVYTDPARREWLKMFVLRSQKEYSQFLKFSHKKCQIGSLDQSYRGVIRFSMEIDLFLLQLYLEHDLGFFCEDWETCNTLVKSACLRRKDVLKETLDFLRSNLENSEEAVLGKVSHLDLVPIVWNRRKYLKILLYLQKLIENQMKRKIKKYSGMSIKKNQTIFEKKNVVSELIPKKKACYDKLLTHRISKLHLPSRIPELLHKSVNPHRLKGNEYLHFKKKRAKPIIINLPNLENIKKNWHLGSLKKNMSSQDIPLLKRGLEMLELLGINELSKYWTIDKRDQERIRRYLQREADHSEITYFSKYFLVVPENLPRFYKILGALRYHLFKQCMTDCSIQDITFLSSLREKIGRLITFCSDKFPYLEDEESGEDLDDTVDFELNYPDGKPGSK